MNQTSSGIDMRLYPGRILLAVEYTALSGGLVHRL